MKNKYIIILVLLSFSSISFSQTFCLSLGNKAISGTDFEFDLYMTRTGPAFQLGTSNLVFDYNQAALSTPVFVSSPMAEPNYYEPTFTNPIPGRVSFNIVLKNDNMGIPINEASTLIGRVKFTIINPALMSNNNWLYSGSTTKTVVFNDIPAPMQLFATDPGTGCLQGLNSPLPVELLDFYSVASASSIGLIWLTAEEQLSHYEILRSTDGNNFSSIAKVTALNNYSESKYEYQDRDVISNTRYYYKLKMVDYDGRFEYSPIISEILSGKQKLVSVYPNPVAKNMEIYVHSDLGVESTFKLFDAKNSTLIIKKFDQNLTIDINGLLPGVYFYTVENKNFSKSDRLIIVE